MFPRQEKRLRLNNQIRAPQVQVIDNTGAHLGTMPLHEALSLANQKNLDAVEVGPTANPPIVKILDFGKYMYQKEKKERGKPKSHSQETKIARFGFKTGMHDLMVKAVQIDKFLKKSHKVRIQVTVRGREKEMSTMAREKLLKFLDLISEAFVKESEIKSYPGGFETLVRPGK